MGLIDKAWKRVLIAVISAAFVSEIISISSKVPDKTKSAIMFVVFIIVLLVLSILSYWIPRFKMFREMKRMDRREEEDLLDN